MDGSGFSEFSENLEPFSLKERNNEKTLCIAIGSR